jgi:hypothetical protein
MRIWAAVSSKSASHGKVRVSPADFAPVLLKAGERAFFAYIFAKNDKDNIKPDELNAFKRLAAELLAHDDDALKKDLQSGALTEVFPAKKTETNGADKGTQ